MGEEMSTSQASHLTPIIAGARTSAPWKEQLSKAPFVMRHTPSFLGGIRFLLAATLVIATSQGTQVRAENLPLTHPTVELVKKYFELVVDQDWKTAAKMIRPASIERKKRETLAIIKSAPTMSEEAAMLGKLGAKDIKSLESMTPEEFYVADRQSFHNPARNDDEKERQKKVQEQKKGSLKIDVLGVIGEQGGKVAHLAVRTSQDVIDQRINELFFISFIQDEADATKWLIAPDMQRPVTEPLSGAAPAPAADAKASDAVTGDKK